MDIMMLRLYIERYIIAHTKPGDSIETYLYLLQTIAANAVDVTNDIIHRENKYADIYFSLDMLGGA